jgi:hypothetical protein
MMDDKITNDVVKYLFLNCKWPEGFREDDKIKHVIRALGDIRDDIAKLVQQKEDVLELIHTYAGVDGAHHKQWLLDQIVRVLCGSEREYTRFVAEHEEGEDGPKTYEWDAGRAP